MYSWLQIGLLLAFGGLLTWALMRVLAVRSASLLPRLSCAERARLDALLVDHLARDGLARSRVTDGDLAALRRSFRLLDSDGDEVDFLDRSGVLARVSQTRTRYYMIQADSGYGKTTFALSLALQAARVRAARVGRTRRADGLVPLYLDLSDFDAALDRLDAWLQAIKVNAGRAQSVGGLRGRPLFLLDAVNETAAPAELAKALRTVFGRLDSQAVFLFLFSFRHDSYAEVLRKELGEIGIAADELQLPFDPLSPAAARDLAFFVQTLVGETPDAGDIVRGLQVRILPFARRALSRRDVGNILRSPDANRFDSPGELLFDTASKGVDLRSPATAAVGELAFYLLGRERVVCETAEFESQVRVLTGTLTAADLMAEMYAHPLVEQGRLVLSESGCRFQSEADIRAFGALHVARCLANREEGSPRQLRGRTRYDVAAEMVLPAYAQLAGSGPNEIEVLEAAITAALTAGDLTDAPFSFYARVLCNAPRDRMSPAVQVTLFHSLIQAIDLHRTYSCEDAIRVARPPDDDVSGVRVNSVLDQLFHVTTAYGDRVVTPLLAVIREDRTTDLQKSQAAYLLLHWLFGLNGDVRDVRDDLWRITEVLRAGDANLHVRYHQMELVEEMLRIVTPILAHLELRDAILATAERIGSAVGDDDARRGDTYGDVQRVLSEYVAYLADREKAPGETSEVVEQVIDTFLLASDASEEQLECWEVVLGLAAREYCRTNDPELRTLILRAFGHELWIVRWWAYTNAVRIYRHDADRAGSGELSRARDGLGERIVEHMTQLDEVEPIGLKKQQCQLVRALLDGDNAISGPALLPLARHVQECCETVTSDPGSRALLRAYSSVFDVDDSKAAEEYLFEFFRQIRELGECAARVCT